MRQIYMEIFFTFTQGLQSGPSEIIAKIEGGGGGGGGRSWGTYPLKDFYTVWRLSLQ